MSIANQNNSKNSSNSSVVNTPASTPINSMANGQINQCTTPPNNAPKYGTLVPNRIFVGGISANTTESELLHLFSAYGPVKAAKIIQDRAGVSKGYGFITFENEDDAKRPLHEADNIVLRERKLNIAPAIKKQPFSRAFDASSPPTVVPGNPAQFFFSPNSTIPFYQGGVAYYPPTGANPADVSNQQPVYQPPPLYPTQTGPPQTATYTSMMFPQTIYMPQQYSMPMPYEYNYYQNPNAATYHQYLSQQQAQQQGVPGGGGLTGSCGPVQPSNSPSRPPCYGNAVSTAATNHQIQQAYVAAAAASVPTDPTSGSLYYNVSHYGAAAPTMEGTPVYEASAYDLPLGPYPSEITKVLAF